MFKDVKRIWGFDYAAAEKQRFKAKTMWEPNDSVDIESYLRRVYQKWPKRTTGMNEEIALKVLLDYGLEGALRLLESTNVREHFEVVGLINYMNRAEPK